MNYAQFLQTNLSKGLTNDQLKVFREFLDTRNNIYIGGGAGVGKSHVTKILSKLCEELGILLHKTASTGVAALNIQAQTLHSFMGLGIGNETGEILFKKVRKNKKAVQRIKSCKCLLIDEISMISGELLDRVYSIFGHFGRIPRVISCGDFLQISPIFKEDRKYAFESDSWKKFKFSNVILNEIVRQDKDSDFAKFLQRVRVGDKSCLSFLDDITISENDIPKGSIVCFSKNIDVDEYNNSELGKLPGEMKKYYSDDDGCEPHLTNLRKNCLAPEVLKLKVGCQVMLLKNINEELVNGSIGIVTKLDQDQVTVDFDGIQEVIGKDSWKIEESFLNENGKVKTKALAVRSQVPLKLAYSVTSHKVQGITCDKIAVDLSGCFATGQMYCALSRARTKEGLRVIGFRPSSLKVDDRCLEFYRNIENSSSN